MSKKHFITAALFILSIGSACAQLGFNGGYSIMYQNFNGSKVGIGGFNAGVSYDFHIKNEWYIFSGLNYQYFLRSEQGRLGIGTIFYNKYNYHFVEMPVQPAFVMEVADDLKLFVLAGPVLSYGLSATKVYEPDGGVSTTTNYYKNEGISPFNLLFGFGIGGQYLNLRLKAGYDWGILNQYSGTADRTYRRNQFKVSLGYIIN